MTSIDATLVEQIRAASRSLVREWGFMGGGFAGTQLSPSAVHALMEIEKGALSARDLGSILRLEKSSVSRMLRKLIESGDVVDGSGDGDGRVKPLSLTPAGRQRVAAIHAHARQQVGDALVRLTPAQARTVRDGLRLYTEALSGHAGSEAAPQVDLATGYRAGLIARITQMHALYYARESGLGQRFESLVAGGLAEFCERLQSGKNAIWTALHGGEVMGSVAIDGEDLGGNVAHLRWFIVDDAVRGSGAGRRLLAAAMRFVDERRFDETHLWTFSGLSAARHLYESLGFVCIEEAPGTQWGKEVLEQKFVRRRPTGS